MWQGKLNGRRIRRQTNVPFKNCRLGNLVKTAKLRLHLKLSVVDDQWSVGWKNPGFWTKAGGTKTGGAKAGGVKAGGDKWTIMRLP